MDRELQQIGMVVKLADKMADRLWKIKHNFGDSAQKRCIAYILDRKDWFFSDLGLEKKQPNTL